MNTSYKKILQIFIGLASIPALVAPASSQTNYPTKPIKLSIGFAPGGATDVLARVISKELGEKLDQTIVVENKPGGATRIAMEYVKNAKPDGYTLGLATAVITTFTHMFDDFQFSSDTDFQPISLVGRAPTFLMVNASLPIKSYEDFVKYGKEQGSLSFGHPGNGSNPHIAGLALGMDADINIVPVGYRGTQPTATAVGSGEVDFSTSEYTVAKPMVDAGRARLITVTEPERTDLEPKIPSSRELGITSDVEGLAPWFMLIAPPNTPISIISLLNDNIMEIMSKPSVQEKLMNIGIQVDTKTPTESKTYHNEQQDKVNRLIKQFNIELKQ